MRENGDPMKTLPIKRLASGGVITNYHCVSRCGHCLYNSSPKRPNDYLDTATAEAIFERISDLGCRSVHIGGGEPLLSPSKLIGVLSAADQWGVAIEYVETNSAWYRTPEQAEGILESLLSAGASTLLISISPFHNAHIPWSRVKGVIEACRRTGMGIIPWVNAFVRDLTHLNQDECHAMSEFEAIFGPGYLKRIPNRYWIHFGGRSLDTFRDVFPIHSVEHLLEAAPKSCAQALSDTSHFHIDLYGNYIPGLCTGLAIEMQDLGQALPSGKYALLERLSQGGIRGLFDHAVNAHNYHPGKNGFITHCDLCTDIRWFLWRQNRNAHAELAPDGFYRELAP